MIKTFKDKSLRDLFETGKSAKIDNRMHKRITMRLDVLENAAEPDDMNIAGFSFHQLQGQKKGNARYTVHVNGPWCITFGFEGNDAVDVDLEQYH